MGWLQKTTDFGRSLLARWMVVPAMVVWYVSASLVVALQKSTRLVQSQTGQNGAGRANQAVEDPVSPAVVAPELRSTCYAHTGRSAIALGTSPYVALACVSRAARAAALDARHTPGLAGQMGNLHHHW